MKELKIGLVGAGWMGKVHSMSYRTALSAFGPLPAVPVLEAVTDASIGIARQAAADFGYNRAVGSWREIVDDPTIDLVDICTPNDMHFDVAMAAIAAGKHIYCEKPLANSVDMARKMTEAAEKAGVVTLIGLNYIQNPVHSLAKKAIDKGSLGNIDYVKLYFSGDFMADRNMPHTWRHEVERAGSGVISDLGVHCLSYFKYLIGREIEQVLCSLQVVISDHPAPTAASSFKIGTSGDASQRIKNTTEDIALVIFRFAGGGVGQIELNRVATGIRYAIGYDIIGSKGTLRYSYDRINDLLFYEGKGEPDMRGFKTIEMGPSDPRFAALHPVSGLGLGYNDFKAIEAREMIAAIGDGRPAYPDFRFGYELQRVVDACVQSDREGRWVKISELQA
jgi:predicted dehydrogenase